MGASASRNTGPQMGRTQRTGLTVPKKILPRIVSVEADKKPLTLRIRWDKGDESRVDVSGLIETSAFMSHCAGRRNCSDKCVLANMEPMSSGRTKSTWPPIRCGVSRKNRRASLCRRTLSGAGANAEPTRSTLRRMRSASAVVWWPIMNRARNPSARRCACDAGPRSRRAINERGYPTAATTTDHD